MKVVVLGAGIIVVRVGQSRTRGHGHRSAERAGAGNKFCKCRRDFVRLLLAMGCARNPLKGHEMALHETCATDPSPKLDTAMLSWMARMLTNCTADRYALNKSRMLQLSDYSRK